MDIINKTKLPQRIPLPGGKKLHLAPGATGQISPKAADHPPLKKLVEDGTIEFGIGKRSTGKGGPGGGGGVSSSQTGGGGAGGIRHTGDR